MSQQVVHLRVNDAATGRHTPVRLRITTPDGQYLPPLGRTSAIPTGDGEAVGGSVLLDGREFAYIDGSCEIRLPAGPLHVEISKGFEYRPVITEVVRKTGQIALRLAIERHSDWSKEGWYAGDTNAERLTPAAAWLEGAAEGLHVVNLLASDAAPSSLLEFSGQHPALERDGTLVVVGTRNRGGEVGDLSLLNAHRVIFPLRLGEEGFEKYMLSDWCQQCHRKGGLVVRPNFPRSDDGLSDDGIYRGGIDAVEWTGAIDFTAGLASWYAKLNQGLRLPIVGGSGKRSNAAALGSPRTYAQLEAGQPLSFSAWIEAIRIGRTFATRGPLLGFEVNGRGPGRAVPREEVTEPLRMQATAAGLLGCDRLEVVLNGKVIAAGEGKSELHIERPVGERGWLAGRCWLAGQLMAHTSAVYVPGSA